MINPVPGCSYCEGTIGPNGCPHHGPQATKPLNIYSKDEELHLKLDRIIELLEILIGVRK